MSIGNNIKKWRDIRNLKQSELAELIGVSDKTISSWEINRTEPKMGMVEKLCIALNCKKTDIVGDDETESANLLIDYHPYNTDATFQRLLSYYRMLNNYGKEAAAERIQELTELSKYVEVQNTDSIIQTMNERWNTYSNAPVAAHNDHESEEGELEKMQRDADGLKRPE